MQTKRNDSYAAYGSWKHMKERCSNPNNNRYKSHGGRGIKVCDRWGGKGGFVNFLEDMGERPRGRSIDRIDNDGDYEPGNCRWSTSKEQARNRRTSRFITIGEETKSFAQWAEESGINPKTVNTRFYSYKWDIKRALGLS